MAFLLKVAIILAAVLPLISADAPPQTVPWQPHTFSSVPGFPGFPAGFPVYAFPAGFPYNPEYLYQLIRQYNIALNSAVNSAASNTAAATLAAFNTAQQYASQFPYRALDPNQQQPMFAQ